MRLPRQASSFEHTAPYQGLFRRVDLLKLDVDEGLGLSYEAIVRVKHKLVAGGVEAPEGDEIVERLDFDRRGRPVSVFARLVGPLLSLPIKTPSDVLVLTGLWGEFRLSRPNPYTGYQRVVSWHPIHADDGDARKYVTPITPRYQFKKRGGVYELRFAQGSILEEATIPCLLGLDYCHRILTAESPVYPADLRPVASPQGHRLIVADASDAAIASGVLSARARVSHQAVLDWDSVQDLLDSYAKHIRQFRQLREDCAPKEEQELARTRDEIAKHLTNGVRNKDRGLMRRLLRAIDGLDENETARYVGQLRAVVLGNPGQEFHGGNAAEANRKRIHSALQYAFARLAAHEMPCLADHLKKSIKRSRGGYIYWPNDPTISWVCE
jgi:hypothetical protein